MEKRQLKQAEFSQRLHIILLGVSNIEKSTEFYDSLGWKRSSDSHAGFVKYDLGGIAIALISIHDLSKDIGEPTKKSIGFRGTALIYLARSADQVQSLLDKAKLAGGTIVKNATRTEWGTAGYFKDPDGYLFEVDFEEKFEFTDDYKLITE